MQIDWLKTALVGEGDKIPSTPKALLNWVHQRDKNDNSDKKPLEGLTKTSPVVTKEKKNHEKERRSTKFYEVLLTMVAVPTMVGVILWTASQLSGMFHLEGERAVQTRSASFLTSPSMLQSGGLGQDSLRKEEMNLPLRLLMGSGRQLRYSEKPSNYPKVSSSQLDDSLAYASDVIGKSTRLEMNLESAEVRVVEGSAEHGQLIASYPRREALKKQKNGLVASRASLHLSHILCSRHGLNYDDCAKFVSSVNLSGTELGKNCEWRRGGEVGISTSSHPSCSLKSPFRTADGTCNNIKNPALGKTYTGYRRLLFPKYADGFVQIRRSVSGKPLPSARLVSSSVAMDVDKPDKVTTLSLMQWTQFVEHDLAHTPSAMMLSTGTPIMCCRDNGFHLSPRFRHPSCAPVDIPDRDPFYSKHRQHCMNYVRSITTIRPGCTLGPSEQVNQATHFLDASMIYGPDSETQRSVRSFTGGKLKTNEQEIETSIGKRGVEFFAEEAISFDFCQLKSTGGYQCYNGGDSRANEHPQITALHTIWLREHNRLAEKLAELNIHWDDERLFQEARRILIAQLQHITYNEWLPLIIGKDYYNKLFPVNNKVESSSDQNIDPSTSNEFASAAIRFAHSMMESNIRLYEENRNVNETLLLRNHYNHPKIVEEPGHFDSLIRGMATQNSQKMDRHFSSDVTSLLWREKKDFGMDIVSLDIQRGRDHGLQPYNQYRAYCGLPIAKEFNDLLDVIPKQTVDTLRRVYDHVDDIDLYVGGISESLNVDPKSDGNILEAGLLGPTFRCIIGEQLLRTKMGDRLFYDNNQEDFGFTASQIAQLKNVSLARIYCDNGNEVKSMQTNVFLAPSQMTNQMSTCDDYSRIPSLDLTPWKEL